jgi:hypothetical protein
MTLFLYSQKVAVFGQSTVLNSLVVSTFGIHVPNIPDVSILKIDAISFNSPIYDESELSLRKVVFYG